MKMVMYLMRQGLLDEIQTERYTPLEEIQNPLECFQVILKEKGSDINNARKLYCWGQREFFYYYFDHSVQVYLSNQLNENMKSSTRISKSNNIIRKTLDQKSPIEPSVLWDQAKIYVRDKQMLNEAIKSMEIYKFLKTTKKTVKKYCYELYQWIENEIDRQNKLLDKLIEDHRRLNVIEAVKILIKEGIHPSYEKIAELAEVPKRYIFTHHSVRIALEETKEKELSLHIYSKT